MQKEKKDNFWTGGITLIQVQKHVFIIFSILNVVVIEWNKIGVISAECVIDFTKFEKLSNFTWTIAITMQYVFQIMNQKDLL